MEQFYQGSTFSYAGSFPMIDDSGQPVSAADVAVTAAIRFKRHGQSVALDVSHSVAGPSNSIVDVLAEAMDSVTAAWPTGEAEIQFRFQFGSGHVVKTGKDQIMILEAVL